MSVLEKRLQVLLDDDRFERLAAESARSGRSVGSIVRAAIDLHFSTEDVAAARSAAARRLLERTSEPNDVEPDWADTKAALEAQLDRGAVQ
ncbi:antitoxin [Ruania alkalisoli]|uniref:Antitoxin n=1 Tax=Ruania alkalisoli TaxID=2779775 RepID=A0A7M1SVC0_9MICO|nr:antitoxin [Ruania alkalisoli]QOR70702.1 antitoxin [Ruania alkalisoli]